MTLTLYFFHMATKPSEVNIKRSVDYNHMVLHQPGVQPTTGDMLLNYKLGTTGCLNAIQQIQYRALKLLLSIHPSIHPPTQMYNLILITHQGSSYTS